MKDQVVWHVELFCVVCCCWWYNVDFHVVGGPNVRPADPTRGLVDRREGEEVIHSTFFSCGPRCFPAASINNMYYT